MAAPPIQPRIPSFHPFIHTLQGQTSNEANARALFIAKSRRLACDWNSSRGLQEPHDATVMLALSRCLMAGTVAAITFLVEEDFHWEP